MFQKNESRECEEDVEKERGAIRKALKAVSLFVCGVAALHAVDQFTSSKGVDFGAKPAEAAEPKKAPPTTLTERVDLSPEVLARLNGFTKEELFRFVLDDYKTIKNSGIIETAELESMMREAVKIMAEKFHYAFWQNFEKIPKEFLTSEIIKIVTEKSAISFWRNFGGIPKELLTLRIIEVATEKYLPGFWKKFDGIPKEFLTSKTIANAAMVMLKGRSIDDYGIHRKKFWQNFEKIPKKILTPEIIKIAAEKYLPGFWKKFEKIPKKILTPEIIKIAAEKYPRDFVENYKAVEKLGIIDPAELKKMGREAAGGF